MRVVISIGGSVFVPNLDARRTEGYASTVETLVWDGCEIGAVIGDGGVTCDCIDAAYDLGANEVQLDQTDIDVTRVNAHLLVAVLGSQIDPKVTHNYEDTDDAIQRGGISVMGGVIPGQTTDAVAVALAEYVDADLLVYATSVDGVLSVDPNSGPNATEFEEMTTAELIDVIGNIEMNTRSPALVGLFAAKLVERARIRTIVLDSMDPDHIMSAVPRSEHTGTGIIPEGDDEPTYWTP